MEIDGDSLGFVELLEFVEFVGFAQGGDSWRQVETGRDSLSFTGTYLLHQL